MPCLLYTSPQTGKIQIRLHVTSPLSFVKTGKGPAAAYAPPQKNRTPKRAARPLARLFEAAALPVQAWPPSFGKQWAGKARAAYAPLCAQGRAARGRPVLFTAAAAKAWLVRPLPGRCTLRGQKAALSGALPQESIAPRKTVLRTASSASLNSRRDVDKRQGASVPRAFWCSALAAVCAFMCWARF